MMLDFDEVMSGLDRSQWRTAAQVALALRYDGDLSEIRRQLEHAVTGGRVRMLRDTPKSIPKFRLSEWRD